MRKLRISAVYKHLTDDVLLSDQERIAIPILTYKSLRNCSFNRHMHSARIGITEIVLCRTCVEKYKADIRRRLLNVSLV